MSDDVVTEFEKRLEERVGELEPLIAEYEKCKKALAALRSTHVVTPKPAPAARPKPKGKGKAKPRRRTRARPGGRRDEVLVRVRENPGISVPGLGELLGVDSTGLYRVVRELETEGLIQKDGRVLRPVNWPAPDAAQEAEAA